MIRRLTVLAIMACLILCAGCGAKKARKSGGKGAYTVAGKTYYPLKSAHGFVEEGMASWYGPGFHGKTTASGETYNQYAMTAAHKILPLGTNARVTHLGNGKSVLVKINDRGPFVADRIIDLSRAAADRLQMVGGGTARVRVQSLGDVAAEGSSGAIKGDFYIQAGAFGNKENAHKLIAVLTRAGNRGRLVFGNNNMWNVQIGPWPNSATAEKMLETFRANYPGAFVVGGS